MAEAVIVEALRTPIARGKPIVGDLNGFHATELLVLSMRPVVERAGLAYEEVDQLIGGCVTQAGEQAGNVTRNAWLSMGKSYAPGATTVDAQCGSAQQANYLISALVNNGSIDTGIACGVEAMSRVGLGQNVYQGPGFFQPKSWPWDSMPDQFASAERIVKNRGISHQDADEFALRSQLRAQAAWDAGCFDREVIEVDVPVVGEDGKLTGETRKVNRDQGLRATTINALASLRTVADGGIHKPGNSSQISDGSAAILWMSKDEALTRGLKPRDRIITDVVVGADPYHLLDGPVDATHKMLKKSGMSMSDIDLFEVNEAFAAVVMSWADVFNPDMDKVNPNGWAIALGHPVGSTGTRLIISALHELERTDKTTALITMCCGASIGTGTIMERI